MHRVDRYAMYLRELSGVAEAYAMFIFPTELPYNILYYYDRMFT